MNTEHANAALFAALALAQGEIENASKNAANPHFKSKYADLAEVLNTIRPVFAKHGLTIVQFPQFDGARASVVTLIGHKDGGFITAEAACVPAKSDAQGIGSATTYLRRYSAAAAAGIAQEDDDGQAAAHNRKPEAVTEIAQAKSSEFSEAIRDAGDLSTLKKVGGDLAKSKLPENMKAALRALYSQRQSELSQDVAA
jgi:PAS domain-containing protein